MPRPRRSVFAFSFSLVVFAAPAAVLAAPKASHEPHDPPRVAAPLEWGLLAGLGYSFGGLGMAGPISTVAAERHVVGPLWFTLVGSASFSASTGNFGGSSDAYSLSLMPGIRIASRPMGAVTLSGILSAGGSYSRSSSSEGGSAFAYETNYFGGTARVALAIDVAATRQLGFRLTPLGFLGSYGNSYDTWGSDQRLSLSGGFQPTVEVRAAF